MSRLGHRVTWFDRLNASLLMLVSPEHSAMALLRRASRERRPIRTTPITMPLEYATVAGIRVRFARGGTSDGPTVLLLNPLPQSIVAFDPLWQVLGREFRLVAYDLPGFGGSEGGTEWMSFSRQAAFLGDFINAMGIDRPHVVAPDIGMPTALGYAARTDCRARSLIVGDGPCLVAGSNGSLVEKLVHSAFWRTVIRIAGPGAAIDGAHRLCLVNDRPSPDEMSDYIAGLSGRMGNMLRWFSGYPESLAWLEPQLPRVTLPTRIFWGDADKLLFVDNGSRLAEVLPNASLTILPNCGHFSYQDQSDRFARMVREWVLAHE